MDVQDLSVSITTFKSNKQVRLVQNEQKPSIVKYQTTLDHHIWRLYEHVDVKYEHEDEDNMNSCSSYNRRDFLSFTKARMRRTDKVGDSSFHRAATFGGLPTSLLGRHRFGRQPSIDIVKVDESKNPVISFQCRAGNQAASHKSVYIWRFSSNLIGFLTFSEKTRLLLLGKKRFE